MKAILKISLLLILSSLFFGCSIQKRRYNKGFHVEWKAFNFKNKKVESDDIQEEKSDEIAFEDDSHNEEIEEEKPIYAYESPIEAIDQTPPFNSTEEVEFQEESRPQDTRLDRIESPPKSLEKSEPNVAGTLLIIILILLGLAILISAYIFSHWSLINILNGVELLWSWIILLTCSGLFAIAVFAFNNIKDALFINGGMLIIFVGFVMLEFFLLPGIPWIIRIVSLLCAYAWLLFYPSIAS